MATLLLLSDTVWGRLDNLRPSITPYDGQVPTTPDTAQYVVFYPGGGVITADRVGDLGSRLTWGCYLVCAGNTRQQAVNVADKTRAVLHGFRPDPAESASALTEVDIGADIVRDDSVSTDIRFSLTLRYTLTSTRS